MHWIDWALLILLSIAITLQGVWLTRKENKKTKHNKNYSLRSIHISVLAAQFTITSLIFIPSHAYHVGMGFIQYYFGIPLAIILVCLIVVPIYNRYFYKYNIQTAYGFLQKRFDDKTRILVSILFLVQRGMATGMIILAPAIIISSILKVSLNWTNIIIGIIVLLFFIFININAIVTMKKYHMYSIIGLMLITFGILFFKLTGITSVKHIVDVAGYSDKLNLVDFKIDLKDKYNIWTAIFGSSLLFLGNYSTSQQNVSSYLSDTPVKLIRWKMIIKAITKIPVMFLILSMAALLYVFYIFNKAPLHFNQSNVAQIKNSTFAPQYQKLEDELGTVFSQKMKVAHVLVKNEENKQIFNKNREELRQLEQKETKLRREGRQLMQKFANVYGINLNKRDKDYVFISFIRDNMPVGLVGIILGMLFFASIFLIIYSINNLSKTTLHDIFYHKKEIKTETQEYNRLQKLLKYTWLIICVLISLFITPFANLIEALIIIASLFCGSMLGLFFIGFFVKYVRSDAAFLGFLVSELGIITIFFLERLHIVHVSFLWLNLLGTIFAIVLCILFQWIFNSFRLKSIPVESE
ncbi:hypothetical protein [Aureivirga sp. CE67]|uniref:hypothetical protein n=1 Tax=Aureivirga sp. CE67 TaxID=1788983 RepID=UPI0018CA7E39|nr:hypothetical protein [Aureivirga sp. CE67]